MVQGFVMINISGKHSRRFKSYSVIVLQERKSFKPQSCVEIFIIAVERDNFKVFVQFFPQFVHGLYEQIENMSAVADNARNIRALGKISGDFVQSRIASENKVMGVVDVVRRQPMVESFDPAADRGHYVVEGDHTYGRVLFC